jgi:hypothetical protein
MSYFVWSALAILGGLSMTLTFAWLDRRQRRHRQQQAEREAFDHLLRGQPGAPRCPVCATTIQWRINYDGRLDLRQCIHGHVFCASQTRV